MFTQSDTPVNFFLKKKTKKPQHLGNICEGMSMPWIMLDNSERLMTQKKSPFLINSCHTIARGLLTNEYSV